jgi:hypothetical protein
MDAVFEIEEEGFDDEAGELVTIGVAQPPNTLMSFTGKNKTIHLVSTDLCEERDPTDVLMHLIEKGLDSYFMDCENLKIVVEE